MAGFFRSSRDQPPQGSYTPVSSYGGLPNGPRAGAPSPGAGYSSRGTPPAGHNEKPHHGAPSRKPPPMGNISYSIVPMPGTGNELVMRNRVIVNPSDFSNHRHVLVNSYPVTTLHDPTGTVQPGCIALSGLQRAWMDVSVGVQVPVESLPEAHVRNLYLASLDIEIGFHKPNQHSTEQYSADDMARHLIKVYGGQMFGIGQTASFDFKGQNLKAVMRGMQVLDLSHNSANNVGATMGILVEETDVTFMKAADSNIKLKASAKKPAPNAILAPNFKFEDMGIGGLDTEFSMIFRRAFASRVFPPGLVEKLGIQHVKGLLLHGPPGTGKTLMARQIGKMLNAREPKIVNGPEILSKYVGASEENIRKLFADAEKEYKAKGDESGLHIIIFDELDAICKQRGSTNSGTGVGDSVVNQLLSKMDGVDQLNNILIIGMTNRLDMIDEALLRPGRLEVHMEISLPDENGRVQILNIHTTKMRTNGIMARDVNLNELAGLTKNFSGAEISGLVKSATSFAFNRHVKVGTVAGISNDVEDLRVNRDDFMNALDEVHPAFGVAEEELQQVIQNGIIHYELSVDNLLHDGQLLVEQVRTSQRTPLVSALLYGPPGSGKTAMAATIAQASEFPFIKLVSPENMVGFSESQKIAAISKAFADSYKSPLSIVVVDNIERLLEWVPIGPRFSNAILQTLLVLIAKRPPKGKRLFVMVTTSLRPALTDLQMSDLFDTELYVPPISTLSAMQFAIKELELFTQPSDLQRAMTRLEQSGFGQGDEFERVKRSVGIKKLLSIVEMARQEPDNIPEQLVSSIMGSTI